MFLGDDKRWLADMCGRDHGRSAIIGAPAQVVEIVHAYEAVGVDELLVPDSSSPTRRVGDTIAVSWPRWRGSSARVGGRGPSGTGASQPASLTTGGAQTACQLASRSRIFVAGSGSTPRSSSIAMARSATTLVRS
jgi:hypothetical protein